MSTCPGHDVDARSSAKHSSHGQRHGASVEMRIGLRYEFPIALGSKVFEPSICFTYAWHIVITTSLKQQDADLWIFCQAARYNRARRTRATDDEVVLRFYTGRECSLIRTHTLRQIYF